MQYQLPIFENLCPGWEKISPLGVRVSFPKGTQIVHLESMVNGVYYVQEGLIEVDLYTLHGPEKVLYYVGPGCIFGEVTCFVTGESREATTRARTDCVLYFFSRELIEGTITSNHPQLLLELIRAEAHKIKMYGVLLKDSLNTDNFIRVCKMLVYLVRYKNAELAGGQRQVLIQPGLTQNDIARLMGVHRVTVTKAISRLKGMGLVASFSKNVLDIPDFLALVELIDQAEI